MDDDVSSLPYGDPSPGNTDFMNLTFEQRKTLQTLERVGGSLSLVGVCVIFITFAAFKRLRTVPNTFILFASIANVGASVACLIGYDGLNAGDDSALCQVQGFLLEMFMQSDPWWSLAMAVNVYMVFFLGANPTSFRQYLWIYCLVCFGAPAIPAVVLLLIRGDPRGPIYGNATLWCWIGDSWNSLRIFTYYAPIWVCIMLSAVIYFAVGYQVFHQRNQLRNLTLSNPAKDTSSSDVRESGERATFDGQPGCYGMVTTEVRVTAEASTSDDHLTPPSTPAPSIAPVLPCKPATHHHHHTWESHSPSGAPILDPSDPSNWDPAAAPGPSRSLSQRSRAHTITTITTAPPAGARFTTISAISSSAHRHRHHRPRPPPPRSGLLHRLARPLAARLRNLDPVKLAYLRTSFVFALSILITWTPASVNRVYALAHPARASYALNVAGAAVLPLQGVWNCVIYCATSWDGLADGWRGVVERRGTRAGWTRGVDVEAGFELGRPPRVSTMRVVRDGSF